MVTGNLRHYQEEDILSLIERIRDGEQSASVQDLKALLSEVNNRQLGNDYANLVSELLRQRVALGDFAARQAQQQEEGLEQTRAIPIQPAPAQEAPLRRSPRQEERPSRRQMKAQAKAQARAQQEAVAVDFIGQEEAERYPVLHFMVGFAKALGWIFFTLLTLGGMAASAMYLRGDMILMISGMVLSLGVGVIFLLLLYTWAERTKLFLDIEEHLRK